jgi:hypothetical protein
MVIKLRRIKWEGHVVRMVDMRNVYKALAGKRLEKRPFGRPWHGSVTELDVQETGYEGMD